MRLILLLFLIPIASFGQITKEGVYDVINQYREIKKRKTLTIDPKLEAFAQKSADRMAKNNKVTHVRAVDSYALGGENILGTHAKFSNEHVVMLWVDSPSHAKAMFSKKIDSYGVGVAVKGNKVYVACWFR